MIVLAIEWKSLEEMQPAVLKMLKNSIIKDRVSHAYLFAGMRGTGKKAAGIFLAKSLFCKQLTDQFRPCETCINCKRITSGNHPDVHIVEPDGLSIKKWQIEQLQEEFSKTGVETKQKLYMIIHADKMTTSAANSLLKFLEEPEQKTVAILLTEQVQQIIPTIQSRCQLISFQPLSPKVLQQMLITSGITADQALLIAHLTNNVDEALELANNEWFAQAQKKVLKLYEVLKKRSLEALVFLQTDWVEIFKEKEQLNQGLNLLLLIYKDILHIQLERYDDIVFSEWKESLQYDALRISSNSLAEQMTAILEAIKKLRANVNQQLLMEQLVLKLQEGSSFV